MKTLFFARVIVTVLETLSLVHLNDKTETALKPDTKIRRMTESNEIVLSVLCRALVPAQDCQKKSEGVPADNYSPHTGRHTRWYVLQVL